MTSPSGAARPGIEWAVASRPIPGQTVSGDLHVVCERTGGQLIAVMDGLGHGPEAATAAHRGAEVLVAHTQASVTDLFVQCNKDLIATRGMAMSLAVVDFRESTLTWAAVGNVEGVLVRGGGGFGQAKALGQSSTDGKVRSGSAREHLLMRGGVVGFRMPPVRETRLTLSPGDVFVLATDGIDGHFTEMPLFGQAPSVLAPQILDRYGKQSDDALVLVARYVAAE